MLPVVFGLKGPTLLQEEADFFRETDPLGFILFKRNCVERAQIAELTAALRDAVGRDDAPVMIDQEGGRVMRLKPPHWPSYPAAKRFGELAKTDPDAAEEAARLNYALIGADLREVGITMDCAPLLDVPVAGAHEMIGDRAFSNDPETVVRLARAACEGFLSANVMPIVKHLPGYGRAFVDSHKTLPVIEESVDVMDPSDLHPFRCLADMPWGMTAHALYTSIDAERAATVSSTVIRDVVRTRIGFGGILITDDIAMEALSGTLADRAMASLVAGCDIVLHCKGNVEHMRTITDVLPPMSPELSARIVAAEVMRKQGAAGFPLDVTEARHRLTGQLALA